MNFLHKKRLPKGYRFLILQGTMTIPYCHSHRTSINFIFPFLFQRLSILFLLAIRCQWSLSTGTFFIIFIAKITLFSTLQFAEAAAFPLVPDGA